MQQVNGKNICENCFADMKETDLFCSVCGFRMDQYTPSPGALAVGEILAGKYLVGKMLGRGGFGITYLGYDIQGDRKVAIKEYLPDGLAARQPGQNTLTVYTGEKQELFKKGAEKFFEEAKTVSRFNGNPNIVSVYEFFYENNTAYFVMEYLDGMDLKKYVVSRGGKISQEEMAEVIMPVIDALTVVHSAGILHRDISPDNIFVMQDHTTKLLDFGAARQVIGAESKSLSVVLKQGFAPIEQYQTRGNFGPWSDIYSLCASMYFALTGQVGSSFPVIEGSVGAALLCEESESEILELAGECRADLPEKRDPELVLRAVRDVREKGYALNLRRNRWNIAAMSMPVRDAGGAVIAALTLIGTEDDFAAGRRKKQLSILEKAVHECMNRSS